MELAAAVPSSESPERDQQYDNLVLIMFDIMKAYSKVQRDASWFAFQRLGMPDSFLRILRGLHEFSEYRMRTPGQDSDVFSMMLGFREGCCSSPPLYNLWHCLAMQHYRRLEENFLSEPQRAELELQGLPGRPFHLRVRGIPRTNRQSIQRVRLGGVTFADDTSLCCRRSTCEQQEQVLRQTLEQWGEVIKETKTKRLLVGPSTDSPEFSTVDSAKLLGGFFQPDGSYKVEDAHRLARAKMLWRTLKRQLPRFGLNRKLRGRLISAAVVRCLLYGVQCREVCGATVRKWQAWLNSVAREATKTRLQDMHDSKLTQQDVNKSLGIWPIKIYIGQAQLQYLGHVARLSPDRPERIALFGWLPHELPLNTGKSGTKSRRQLWQRLLELMFLHHGTPPSQVAATWEEVAQREGGVYWKSLIKQWCKQQLAVVQQDTWAERHKDLSKQRRTEAAEERVFAELGAKAVGGGKFACPHCCDPPVMMLPKSLRPHIQVCKDLPLEVRQRQAQQRTTYTGKKHRSELSTAAPSSSSSPPAPMIPSQKSEVQPRNVCKLARRRLTTKTPAAEVASSTTTKTVAPCGDWTLEYLHSVRQQYKTKNPRRQITSTDLPKPPVPDGWTEVTRCWFCREVFDSAEARNKHVRACGSTPYNLWLRRVRILQYDARHSLFSCQHCGTQLYTAKAKGRHSITCASRRQQAGLPLGLEAFIPDEDLEKPPN